MKIINETKRLIPVFFALLLSLSFSLPVLADTVTFNIKDRSGLTPGDYSVYVLGISTAGGSDGNGLYLENDGTWRNVSSLPPDVNSVGSGLIPCWELGTDISQMKLDSSQTALSGRVYFMIVTESQKANGISICQSYSNQKGYKGFSNGYFTFSANGTAYKSPATSDVTDGNFPAWVFAEVGCGDTAATIDTSQVDFVSFPINVLAFPEYQHPYDPSYLGGVGNSFDTESTGKGFSNMEAVRNSFTTQFGTDSRYRQLLQSVPGSSQQYIIQNPGAYLKSHEAPQGYCDSPDIHSALSFNCDFKDAVDYLWSSGTPWTGSINSGGAFGSVAQDTFAGTTVQIPYPGTTVLVNAIKFVGNSTDFVAYVFSPADIETMCQEGTMPPADKPVLCGSNSSIGYQIYAGAGALQSPPDKQVSNMKAQPLTYGLKSVTNIADYQAVAGRLGFLISTAFNRGIAGLQECTYSGNLQKIGDCWQDENQWYPQLEPAMAKPEHEYFLQTDDTQTDSYVSGNLFAFWLHTARDSDGNYLFAQPVTPQPWTAGGGTLSFSMGYGFSNDENPTPNPPNPDSSNKLLTQKQAQTPSKWDGNVLYEENGHNFIVLGPWTSGTENPSPNKGVNPPPEPPVTCASTTVSADSLLPYYDTNLPPVDTICINATSVENFTVPGQSQVVYKWTCVNDSGSVQCTSTAISPDYQWPTCAAPPNSSTWKTSPPSDTTLCHNGEAVSFQYKSYPPPSTWECQTYPLDKGQHSKTPEKVPCQAAAPSHR